MCYEKKIPENKGTVEENESDSQEKELGWEVSNYERFPAKYCRSSSEISKTLSESVQEEMRGEEEMREKYYGKFAGTN